MESLPVELSSNILLRLPIKTLGQVKCVSKTYKTLISSPYFTKTHHNQTPYADRQHQLVVCAASSLNTVDLFHNDHQHPRPRYLRLPSNPMKNFCGAIELVGSCNGLVCLFYPPKTYSLLNPTTRQVRVLPTFPGDAKIKLSGFGYVSKFDDLMVASAGSDESVMRVFSAKADSWKMVMTRVPFRVIPWVKPVYANGVVHWLSFDSGSLPVNKIMGFDFVEEDLKVLPLCEDMNNKMITTLGVLGGSVCALSVTVHQTDLDLWVMMEYGVKESWMRILQLEVVHPYSPFVSLSPVCYTGDQIFFLADSRRIIVSDFDNGTILDIAVELQLTGGGADVQVALYEESLISPYDYVDYIC